MRTNSPSSETKKTSAHLPPARASLGTEMLASAYALMQMQQGLRLGTALDQVFLDPNLPASSHAAIQDIAYTSARQWALTKKLLQLLVTKRPDDLTSALIQTAMTQLLVGWRAPAIVVDQTVDTCGQLEALKPKRALVNAVLRRFLREQEALLTSARQDPEALHNFPLWWIDRLNRAWGEADATESMRVAQTVPPFTLRINPLWGDAQAYAQACREHALTTQLEPLAVPRANGGGPSQCLVLQPAVAVQSLPGFAQGWASVQDLAAQLAAPLLDVSANHIVLDACAAPGGKTTHLLEGGPAQLWAVDSEPGRMVRIKQNLARYDTYSKDTQLHLITADLLEWEPPAEVQFDRILLDAPCSSSGVVRRHPDIRWLRRRGDITTLSLIQKRLLSRLWSWLKPGGKLLYATCSIFAEENDDIVRSFVDKTADAEWLPLTAPLPGLRLAPGRRLSLQLLPNDGADTGGAAARSLAIPARTTYGHDGFYLALLQKRI
jgi:16S rRNA (cytosine967-C5)-methyltransferase